MPPTAEARREFRRRFGGEPDGVAVAPGRVNIIGDHTDYNDGFVLPMAIDRSLAIAFRARRDDTVRVVSGDEQASFDRSSPTRGDPPWSEYLRGVAWSLASASSASGWDGTIVSDIPAGASLSSSAALEVATGLVFDHLAGVTTPRLELARACQRAEREWVGMECGIMDQMSVAMSRAGHALLIDCRTLEHRLVPVPEGAAFVVLDTTTRRALTESPYNDRRAACERAARHLGVTALRDVDLADLEAHRDTLDPEDLRRARHVVTENARVLATVDALHDGDIERLGELMTDSHVSLRDDFASSSPELDAIVEAAIGAPGCHGARVTGAGFGGCAVALVDSAVADEFTERVGRDYESATGIAPRVFPCSAADGATLEVP